MDSQISSVAIGIIGILSFITLVFIGVPIALSTAIVGIFGVFWLKGFTAATTVTWLFSFNTARDFPLAAIPFYILMGELLFKCGVGEEVFTAMRNWLGHYRGGLAIATTAACAALGTCTGSSQAEAAIMAEMAYPEMRKHGYHPSLAFGVITASGTLAAIIPPSIQIVMYGTMVQLGVGKVFIAGFTAGAIEAITYIALLMILVRLKPDLAPLLPPVPWRIRFASLKYLIPPVIMFIIIIGGMYKGVFTATEAGGIAATAALSLVLLMGRLTWAGFKEAIMETARVTLLVMAMFIGITILTRFLIYSGVLLAFAEFALTFPSPAITLALMLTVFFILGMFLDSLGMLMVTVPIFLPVVKALGYDSIWFGIITIKMCEIAWITPPVALNVFVVQSITKELSLEQAFRAVLPFIVCDFSNILLFIAFPQILLFLPKLLG